MGLNICVYKVTSKGTDELAGGELVPYYEFDRQDDWWDSLRQVGDKQFVSDNDFDYYEDSNETNQDLMRPSNIDACKKWVKENACNKKRLLEVLDKMEQDKDLVFYFSR